MIGVAVALVSLSAPAAAKGSGTAAAAPETVVISAETICADDPGSAYCRERGPRAPARTGPAPAGDAWSARLGELERRAPWIRGYVPWCEAFPSEPVCRRRSR